MSATQVSTSFENITYEVKGSIGYITLNRPKVMNALNRRTVEELNAAFSAEKEDATVKGIILTGAGEKAFIAGADIAELSAIDGEQAGEFSEKGQEVLLFIETLGKPVIAAVNGFALGGGCETAMACTIRIAAENAKFGQPEVKLGVIPGYGGTQRLPRLVGKGRALQLILTGDLIDAHEAHRIGLVNEVVPAADLISRCEAILKQIDTNAPIAIRYAIDAVNKGVDTDLTSGLKIEAKHFGRRLETIGLEYNALACSLLKRAKDDVDDVDDEFKRGRFRGPLQGIPYGVKDLIAVAGYPTTWGAKPFANQMFDHYEFSGDRDFLRREGYPAMKEAAEFALGILVEAPAGTPFAGRLVTNPSTSPENQYLLNGQRHYLTYGPTMDIELIRELFENCRRAAEILGADTQFSAALDRAEKRLPPLQIGKRGQLQEWIEDYGENEPQHRHVSHLYSLYPGHDISLKITPELAAAVKRSLELRGDGESGWSTMWRTALWARLQNPERAYANLKILITTRTLPNMFDQGPPFQIDGNLGGTAAITEMLVQSTPNEIVVLPALPPQWSSGSLKGVRVRGGGKVDIAWNGGRLTELRVRSDRAGKYRIRYGDNTVNLETQRDKPITLDRNLHRIAH